MSQPGSSTRFFEEAQLLNDEAMSQIIAQVDLISPKLAAVLQQIADSWSKLLFKRALRKYREQSARTARTKCKIEDLSQCSIDSLSRENASLQRMAEKVTSQQDELSSKKAELSVLERKLNVLREESRRLHNIMQEQQDLEFAMGQGRSASSSVGALTPGSEADADMDVELRARVARLHPLDAPIYRCHQTMQQCFDEVECGIARRAQLLAKMQACDSELQRKFQDVADSVRPTRKHYTSRAVQANMSHAKNGTSASFGSTRNRDKIRQKSSHGLQRDTNAREKLQTVGGRQAAFAAAAAASAAINAAMTAMSAAVMAAKALIDRAETVSDAVCVGTEAVAEMVRGTPRLPHRMPLLGAHLPQDLRELMTQRPRARCLLSLRTTNLRVVQFLAFASQSAHHHHYHHHRGGRCSQSDQTDSHEHSHSPSHTNRSSKRQEGTAQLHDHSQNRRHIRRASSHKKNYGTSKGRGRYRRTAGTLLFQFIQSRVAGAANENSSVYHDSAVNVQLVDMLCSQLVESVRYFATKSVYCELLSLWLGITPMEKRAVGGGSLLRRRSSVGKKLLDLTSDVVVHQRMTALLEFLDFADLDEHVHAWEARAQASQEAHGGELRRQRFGVALQAPPSVDNVTLPRPTAIEAAYAFMAPVSTPDMYALIKALHSGRNAPVKLVDLIVMFYDVWDHVQQRIMGECTRQFLAHSAHYEVRDDVMYPIASGAQPTESSVPLATREDFVQMDVVASSATASRLFADAARRAEIARHFARQRVWKSVHDPSSGQMVHFDDRGRTCADLPPVLPCVALSCEECMGTLFEHHLRTKEGLFRARKLSRQVARLLMPRLTKMRRRKQFMRDAGLSTSL